MAARKRNPAPRLGASAPAVELRRRLARAVPEPRVELDHANAWQLLVATILSAQSTDERVNRVTPALFRRFPTPAALGAATQEEVEELVRSTGFFRNKARAIRETSAALAERHGGEVPRELSALLALRGVASKTAHLVLGAAYGLATGFAVDTHVARVARRLGLSTEDDPERIGRDLETHFPRAEWIAVNQRLLLHGRYVCTARAPRCSACPLNELCPSREASPEAGVAARAALEARRVAGRGAD